MSDHDTVSRVRTEFVNTFKARRSKRWQHSWPRTTSPVRMHGRIRAEGQGLRPGFIGSLPLALSSQP